MKIHVAVDVKSKKILSLNVTDEHVHDSKVLPKLVEGAKKSNHMSIGKVFADGAYDSNDIFRCLRQWNISMHQIKKECES